MLNIPGSVDSPHSAVFYEKRQFLSLHVKATIFACSSVCRCLNCHTPTKTMTVQQTLLMSLRFVLICVLLHRCNFIPSELGGRPNAVK